MVSHEVVPRKIKEQQSTSTTSYYDNPPEIGHIHTHRCLVEDVALLFPGEVITIAIPSKNKDICSTWEDVIKSQTRQSIKIRKQSFIIVVGHVRSNPASEFVSTHNSITRLKDAIYVKNIGVNVSFKSIQSGSDKVILLKSILCGSEGDLQVWKRGQYNRDFIPY